MGKLKYYSLSYRYPGPRDNACEDMDANKALCSAEKAVRVVEKKLGLHTNHEYSWPDGSLYHGLLSDLGAGQLRKLIEAELPDHFGVDVIPSVPTCGWCDYDFSNKENPNARKQNVVILDEHYAILCGAHLPGHVQFFSVNWIGGEGGPQRPKPYTPPEPVRVPRKKLMREKEEAEFREREKNHVD